MRRPRSPSNHAAPAEVPAPSSRLLLAMLGVGNDDPRNAKPSRKPVEVHARTKPQLAFGAGGTDHHEVVVPLLGCGDQTVLEPAVFGACAVDNATRAGFAIDTPQMFEDFPLDLVFEVVAEQMLSARVDAP